HRVNCFDSRLKGLFDRLSHDDSGSLDMHSPSFLGIDGAFAIDRLSQSIYHSTDKWNPNGNVHDPSCPLDRLSFFDRRIGAENGDPHVVFLEVQHHSHSASWELHELAGHHAIKPINSRDSITYR